MLKSRTSCTRFFCEAQFTFELFAPPDGRDGRMFTSGARQFCDTRSRRRAAAPAVRRSGNGWREGGDKGGQPDRPQRVRVPHAASLCKKPKASCAATAGATRATPLISMTLGGRTSPSVCRGGGLKPAGSDLRRRTHAAVDGATEGVRRAAVRVAFSVLLP